MKKVINAPDRVVEEMLRGMELAHPSLLCLLPEHKVVVRADAPVRGKVALISGGGSGHEPTHGGPGMLDAACREERTHQCKDQESRGASARRWGTSKEADG